MDDKSIEALTSSDDDYQNLRKRNSKATGQTSTIKSSNRTSMKYSLGTDRYDKYVRRQHDQTQLS